MLPNGRPVNGHGKVRSTEEFRGDLNREMLNVREIDANDKHTSTSHEGGSVSATSTI
jgi:hypothetical protein